LATSSIVAACAQLAAPPLPEDVDDPPVPVAVVTPVDVDAAPPPPEPVV
jgi:hypothetical protein